MSDLRTALCIHFWDEGGETMLLGNVVLPTPQSMSFRKGKSSRLCSFLRKYMLMENVGHVLSADCLAIMYYLAMVGQVCVALLV